jgi:hypothetical protein
MPLGHELNHEEAGYDIADELEVLRVHLSERDIHKGGEHAQKLMRSYGGDSVVIDKIREVYDSFGFVFHGYRKETG